MKAERVQVKNEARQSLFVLATKRQLEIKPNAETITTAIFKQCAFELGFIKFDAGADTSNINEVYVQFRSVLGHEWMTTNRVRSGHFNFPVIDENYLPKEVVVEPIMVTMNVAAEMIGKSVSTVSRAIKAGKLVATKTEKGSYLIDTMDIERFKATMV